MSNHTHLKAHQATEVVGYVDRGTCSVCHAETFLFLCSNPITADPWVHTQTDDGIFVVTTPSLGICAGCHIKQHVRVPGCSAR